MSESTVTVLELWALTSSVSTFRWAPKSIEALRDWVPDGDAGLQQAWLEDYFGAIQFMRDNDVPTAEQYRPIMTIGELKLKSVELQHNLTVLRPQASVIRSRFPTCISFTFDVSKTATQAANS